MQPAIHRMGEGKKRVLRKSALVFDDPLEAYEHARKVSRHNTQYCHRFKNWINQFKRSYVATAVSLHGMSYAIVFFFLS